MCCYTDATIKRILKCVSWKVLFLVFSPQFVNIRETNFSRRTSILRPAVHFQYTLLACYWKLLLTAKFFIVTGVCLHSKRNSLTSAVPRRSSLVLYSSRLFLFSISLWGSTVLHSLLYYCLTLVCFFYFSWAKWMQYKVSCSGKPLNT